MNKYKRKLKGVESYVDCCAVRQKFYELRLKLYVYHAYNKYKAEESKPLLEQ
jgi:hypothetical protein